VLSMTVICFAHPVTCVRDLRCESVAVLRGFGKAELMTDFFSITIPVDRSVELLGFRPRSRKIISGRTWPFPPSQERPLRRMRSP
jgi:hypothetical protein